MCRRYASTVRECLHRELELLVEAGSRRCKPLLQPHATPPVFLGQETSWGTLEPGKRADILIVDGTPASRISDARKIELVIQAGRVIDRDALRCNLACDAGSYPAGRGSGK